MRIFAFEELVGVIASPILPIYNPSAFAEPVFSFIYGSENSRLNLFPGPYHQKLSITHSRELYG
jgi:hypothetical protein